jgi:hypothetical protein
MIARTFFCFLHPPIYTYSNGHKITHWPGILAVGLIGDTSHWENFPLPVNDNRK